jgi:hypothetical protein
MGWIVVKYPLHFSCCSDKDARHGLGGSFAEGAFGRGRGFRVIISIQSRENRIFNFSFPCELYEGKT